MRHTTARIAVPATTPVAPAKRGPKGKRGGFTSEQTADLLRDFYIALERRAKTKIVKRTLAAVRAAGATFDNNWAVDILSSFIKAHHRNRRTSPRGSNKKLNTTILNRPENRPENELDNRPGFEHETGRKKYLEIGQKQAGSENNRPGFEHETGRKKDRVDPPSLSISFRSSRSAVETVDNGDFQTLSPLQRLYEIEPRLDPKGKSK